MRGRHMYIGDKTRDQYMRCEVLQQANENDAANLVINKARFLEHVQKFEDQIRNNRVDTTTSQMQGLDGEGGKALPKRSLRDFKPLKARTFMFDKSGVGGPNRQMSAHDAMHGSASTKDFEEVTRIHLGLHELLNNKSSAASVTNPGANFPLHQSAKLS